jgi:hypothetical protein
MQLNFIPIAHREPSRGNVVLVKDTGDVPQMVTRYSWKRGVQVAPYEGAINSRNRQRSQVRAGTNPEPPEWRARWVKLNDVTHIATSGRSRRRGR